jgi:hypothetical protein
MWQYWQCWQSEMVWRFEGCPQFVSWLVSRRFTQFLHLNNWLIARLDQHRNLPKPLKFLLQMWVPLLSLRSSSCILRLPPCLPVTSIHPFIFPSITCCRRQFRLEIWPIQLAFRFERLLYCDVDSKWKNCHNYYFSWIMSFEKQRWMRAASSGHQTAHGYRNIRTFQKGK